MSENVKYLCILRSRDILSAELGTVYSLFYSKSEIQGLLYLVSVKWLISLHAFRQYSKTEN